LATALAAALAVCLVAGSAAASLEEPRRWLIGYHKALFWMSEVEIRFFYDIADAYSPDPRSDARELKLIAASPAPFAGREWEMDFLMRKGRLAAIGLERRDLAAAPETCRRHLADWLDALERLHGEVSEGPEARDEATAAALAFRRGARWELTTAYQDGTCLTRMDLVRAPPSRR
jgi:hypothetical protein